MPATDLIIKKYNRISDIAIDIYKIKEDFTRQLQASNATLASKIEKAFIGAAVFRARGRPVNQKPIIKIGKETLTKHTDKLDKLRKQSNILTNILVNLDQDFADSDPITTSRMKKSAKVLQDKIQEQIDELEEKSNNRTETRIDPTLANIISKVDKVFSKRFDSDGIITYADAMVAGNPEEVAYLTYKDVKNVKGEINPEIVIAFTQANKEFYVNPGLVKILPPGQFNKGNGIRDDKSAIRLIEEQMIADAHLTAISPKPVPFEKSAVTFTKKEGINSIKSDDYSLTLYLDPTVKTLGKAQQIANAARIKIGVAVHQANPKNRDRVVYTIVKSTKQYKVEFKFTTGDKYTGKDIGHEQIKHLEEKFTPSEVKLIRQALLNNQ